MQSYSLLDSYFSISNHARQWYWRGSGRRTLVLFKQLQLLNQSSRLNLLKDAFLKLVEGKLTPDIIQKSFSYSASQIFQTSIYHRIVGVGRDLCGSPSPKPLPKQGHLQQAAQDHVGPGRS